MLVPIMWIQKRCTFCILNLYKHCLFPCSNYFKCQGGSLVSAGVVSLEAKCQAFSISCMLSELSYKTTLFTCP